MIAILLIGPSPVVFGVENQGGNTEEVSELNKEIAARKEKIKKIEKSIQEYKDKIQQKRKESVSLTNQIAIIDNHLAEVKLDIEATNEKLETLSLEIEALEIGIKDKAESIDRQQKILSELIRNIYTHGNKNMLYVLAAYDNFSSFYNQLQHLEMMERDLGKSAKALKVSKGELEEKRDSKNDRKDSYKDMKDRLEERIKDLDEQTFAKQDLLISAQSSELKFQTLVKSLKNQYQSIEYEISSIEKKVREKLKNQDKFNNIDDDSTVLSWPTQSKYITADFHDPEYPYRHIFEHNAIDIRAGQGTPIRAASSGYIGRARVCSSWRCYSYVMIIHSGGLSTVYGHLSKVSVSEGQFVTRGDTIGYSGGSPYTVGAGPFVTGPHLHFEVRKNGIPVNPVNYL